MGGDRGPDEVVAGALAAASDRLTPVLVGPSGLETKGLELIEAPDVIDMDDKPTEAVRAKPNSSLVVACRAGFVPAEPEQESEHELVTWSLRPPPSPCG